MWELFTATETMPFGIAILLMVGIAGLEVISAFFGTAMSDLVDSMLPELDADIDFDVDADLDADIDVDVDADIDGGLESAPILSNLLSWLKIGRVPILMLLIIFLLSFGLSGFFTQSLVKTLTGGYLTAGMASIPASLIAFPAVHYLGGLLEFVLPKDETEAVEEKTLLGREAEIVLGVARKGNAAQAKVVDSFGKTHYVMFEPLGDEEVSAGEKVYLEDKESGVFYGSAQ